MKITVHSPVNFKIDKGKIVSQGSFEELRKLNADFNNQANFMGI